MALPGFVIFHSTELLIYSIRLYPQSGFLLHLLGKAYHQSGQLDLVRKNYLKAIDLAPDCQNVINDYEDLRKELK